MLLLVTYEPTGPEQRYKPWHASVVKRLTELQGTRILTTAWLLDTELPPAEVLKDLHASVSFDRTDRVLIVEVKKNAAWLRLLHEDQTVIQLFEAGRIG